MWHYTQNGEIFGPLPESELDNLVSSGKLAANTLVWRDGMNEWQPYDQVRGAPATAGNVPKVRLQVRSESDSPTPTAPEDPTEKTEASGLLRRAEGAAQRARMEATSSWVAVGALIIAMIVFVGMLANRSARRNGSAKAGVVETLTEDEATPTRKPAAKRAAKLISKRHIEEEVLVTLATNNTTGIVWIDVSPDAKHTACLYKGELKLSPEKQRQIEAEIDAWLNGRSDRLTKTLNAVGRREKRGMIAVDGVQHFPISHSRVRTFSPDSRHFAYIVRNEEDEVKRESDGTSTRPRYDYFVVIDGKPAGKLYTSYVDVRDGLNKLQFSADSSTWSCIAMKSWNPEQHVVVINGREEQAVENPDTKVLFSPAGANYAYETSGLVISSGKSLGPYSSVNNLQFSGDGQHLGFLAERKDRNGEGGEAFLVIDGVEKPLAKDETGYRLMMNSNGIPLVYATRKGAKGRIYLDGKPGPNFEDTTDIALSPDGAHVAYVGRSGKQYHVVFDENVWPDYGRAIGKPVFSPDSRHLACWIKAKGNQGVRVVADGILQAEYIKEDSESIAYSPNGDHLAYVAKKSTNWVLVLDGAERSIPGGNASHTLVFSPDGKRVAIAFKPSGSAAAFCFLDGVRQNPFAEIESMTFTRDGRHLIYVAQAKRRGEYAFGERLPYHVVLDGDEGPELDEIVRVGSRKFWIDDAGQICYIAVRQGKVISFREDPR